MFGGGEDTDIVSANSFSAATAALHSITATVFNVSEDFEDSDILLSGEIALANPNNPCYDISFGGNNKEIQKYTIQKGDTISSLSQSFGISVNTILWANNLHHSSVIKPNDTLEILPVSGVKYVVKKDDTLEKIAKEYKLSSEEIITFNELSGNNLALSSILILPGGTLPNSLQPKIAATVILKKAPSYTTAGQSSGYFIYPAAGHNWGRVHASNGIDISNPKGGPIYAAADGKIILADGIGYNGGYGQYIKIEHPNGVVTLYGHLSKINVKVGDWVQQGSVIGMMGNTGRSTGTHLHFEVRGAKNPLARY